MIGVGVLYSVVSGAEGREGKGREGEGDEDGDY